MRIIFTRSAIILLWLVLIFLALYWPKYQIEEHDKNTLNVFVWGDILEPSIDADFEKETGIKLNFSYYSSNEELIVKLKATKGEGYDLIIPSDYAVNILIKENLLKQLDKSKFAHWDVLNPNLLDQYFDPNNNYSIPFEWELYGFGIDRGFFAAHPVTPSWEMIFNPDIVNYKIVMNNDPIEAVQFASFYLFGNVDSVGLEQVEEIKQLLVRQRAWVAAYANFRGDYFLATKNVALVVASSSYIFRSKRQFDFMGFIVPEEGSFITIENFCIPKPSQKEELTYKFLNYLCSPKSVSAHYNTFGQFPSAQHSLDILHRDPEAARYIFASPKDFQKFHFIRNILPEDVIRDIWVEVKNGDF